MINNELDRRVIKTKQIIYDALYSLMKEKQYDKITVQNIIDRANVGRSTFYSHFTTKDELLKSGIENMMENLNIHMSNAIHDSHSLIPVSELFKHIKENSRLMKALVKGKSADLFLDKVQSYLNEIIEKHICSQLTQDRETKVPINIIINFISSTLIFLIKWWIENKMQYTPIQMEQYFHELVTPSIKAIFIDKPIKEQK